MGPRVASLACLLVLALAGCGTADREVDAAAVAERFHAALDAGDGQAACQQLNEDTASKLEQQEKRAYIVSSAPEHHAERVREVERLGATVVCLQNGSGAAPAQAVRVYGEQVLPALRGARV